MNISTTIKSGLLAGAMAVASPASAFIFFDQTGDTAPGGLFAITAFDWAPDNALFEGIIPIPLDPGFIDGNLRVQGKLTSATSSFIAPGTEITFQSVVPIRATAIVDSGGTTVAFDRILAGGFFDIFFDDTGPGGGLGTTGGIAANDITGLGYGDGRKILHGDVLATPSGQNGSINIQGPNQGLLDQFGLDDQGGVTTLQVQGNFPTFRIEIVPDVVGNIDMTTLGFDTSFFPADINGNTIDVPDDGNPLTEDHDLQLSGDNLAPFENVNPSDSIVGVAPDYGNGINDNLCGGGGDPCDLHTESDTRSPFQANLVPEPGTTALLGLSLLAIGGAAATRRARKAA